MPRERNPRRVVLALLHELKGWATAMKSAWDPGMTVHESGQGWRPRRPDERPENNAEHWERLILYMNAIIGKAAEIKEFAESRQAEVKEGKRW